MRLKQSTLAKIVKQRAKLAALEIEIKTAEDGIFNALKSGASVENGLLKAFIATTTRTNISWKTKLIDAVDERDGEGAGERLCARISAATPATPYENLKIQVA